MALSVPKRTGALSDGDPKNVFGESPTVAASGGTATMATYTVPVGKVFFFDLAEFGGENIAIFTLLIDNLLEAKKCTYFSGPLSDQMFWDGGKYPAGTKFDLKVENFRSEVADFWGRILGVEADA